MVYMFVCMWLCRRKWDDGWWCFTTFRSWRGGGIFWGELTFLKFSWVEKWRTNLLYHYESVNILFKKNYKNTKIHPFCSFCNYNFFFHYRFWIFHFWVKTLGIMWLKPNLNKQSHRSGCGNCSFGWFMVVYVGRVIGIPPIGW